MNFSNQIGEMVGSFLDWIPKLVGAIIVLIIGWIIAYILKAAATGLLKRIGINRKYRELPEESFIRKITGNPAKTIGSFVYWLILIITWTIVIGALDIPVLTDLIRGIYSYVPNLLAAIIILAIAIAGSAFVSGVILRWMGDTPTGKIVSTIVPVVILSISGFAILEQLRIAPIIVITTYIAVIGSLAVASAIAFGLGGREAASRMLNQAYEKGARGVSQARADMDKGRERAKRDIDRETDRRS